MPTRLMPPQGRASFDGRGLTRRDILSFFAKGALLSPVLGSGLLGLARKDQSDDALSALSTWQFSDAALLEEIVSRGFLYFWNEASPQTGLIRDRALADGGPDTRHVSSIAATGFGPTALCIGHQHRYAPSRDIYARVVQTLNFLLNHTEHVNGFYYHFVDLETGRRSRRSEVSPIDTAILLCGVLTARQY